jgi:hypothetical protein
MVVALLIPMDSYVFLPRRWFTILWLYFAQVDSSYLINR